MLEPAMQLDADLGIDSIKRVEILSALQERLPAAPVVKPEHLGTLRTLEDIAAFLDGATPTARPEEAIVCKPEPGPESHAGPGLQRLVVRGAPIAGGVATDGAMILPRGEIWITDDGTGLSHALAKRLAERGHAARIVGWNEVGRVETLERLGGLVLVAPRAEAEVKGSDQVVADAFRWLRAASPALRSAGREGGALAVTVCSIDGGFGTRRPHDAFDPTVGGLAGLVKTAGHEWPDVLCKAIDLDPMLGHGAEAVGLLADELFCAGPVEVGLSASGRLTLVLDPIPIPVEVSKRGSRLSPGDLLVVTGGARGVTAAVALALAGAFRPSLLLIGRSPASQPEPEWLAGLETESEIKRAIAARADGRVTPQWIGEQYRAAAANREILRNLSLIERAGGRVLYRSVDVRNAASVAAAVAEGRDRFGPVRGLVHGAGVLADRKIEDQTDGQFAEVFTTKVAGLRALLRAIGDDDLRLLALFSSSTARFGRSGQGAYAAANEVLNKMARREARLRPGARVVAVNWGPWDGGMVTPALKPLFAAEGVGLIPLAEGARYLVDESTAGDDAVEIVALGPGSVPVSGTAAVPAAPANVLAPAAPMGEPRTAALAAGLTVVFERPLDVHAVPVLKSHVIDGRGVLPMALILEMLAQGALQRNPGLTFCGVDDLRLLKGAVLHEDRPETLCILAGKAVRDDSGYRVPVELRGKFEDGKTVTHARGLVVLGDRSPEGVERKVSPVGLGPDPRSVRAIYSDVLFHGAELHGLERIEATGAEGIIAIARTCPAPERWLHRPLRQAWLADPLALDVAFQLMTYWSADQAGAPALPTRVGRYRQFQREFPSPGVRIVVQSHRPSPLHSRADMEFLDGDGEVVALIEDYECVGNPSLVQAFRRNRLMHPRVAGSSR
jgi:NAD(P)-dependent dehydrogenase (short-subunit alcohol dehydrogenase family)